MGATILVHNKMDVSYTKPTANISANKVMIVRVE